VPKVTQKWRRRSSEDATYNEGWEREAERWAAWARTPGHDAYWMKSGPPLFELLPPPGRATLDVGCGEGRVARDLARRGYRVVGLDASPTLVRLAREADPDSEYVVGDAAALPFADGAFDLVVAFNSLMDVQDMPGAVREAARVLEPEGRLCLCVTHPLSDAGRFEGRAPQAAFVVTGSYFGRRRFEGTFARDGLEITFRGWCYPLEDYTRALEAAGFLVEALREPPAPEEEVRRDPAEKRWRRIPNFLYVRALKP
jgi:SAM-dependent methyltransferase